jgi:hypothetical protein
VQSRKQDGEFLCFLARSGTPVAYLKRPGFFVFPTAGKRSTIFPAAGEWSDAVTKNPAGEGGVVNQFAIWRAFQIGVLSG